jgi:hypothetical protein
MLLAAGARTDVTGRPGCGPTCLIVQNQRGELRFLHDAARRDHPDTGQHDHREPEG